MQNILTFKCVRDSRYISSGIYVNHIIFNVNNKLIDGALKFSTRTGIKFSKCRVLKYLLSKCLFRISLKFSHSINRCKIMLYAI